MNICYKSNSNYFRKAIMSIFLLIAGMSFISCSKNDAESKDKLIAEVVKELNSKCPMTVDAETRLDNAEALPNNTIQYNYTMINLEKAMLNLDELQKGLEQELVANVKNTPELKQFRDMKTTLVYSYKDKNGEFVTKVNVSADKYEK